VANSDYINPIDLCNRLNTYIIPEAAVHGFLTFLFLINGYWIALLLNLPLLAFNVKKYVQFTQISLLPLGVPRAFRSSAYCGGALLTEMSGLWITHIYSTPLRYSGSSMYTRRYGNCRIHGSTRVGGLTVQQESFIKLGFHLIMFFFYLYSMIVALIRDESN
jgi:protein cornichon